MRIVTQTGSVFRLSEDDNGTWWVVFGNGNLRSKAEILKPIPWPPVIGESITIQAPHLGGWITAPIVKFLGDNNEALSTSTSLVKCKLN